MLLCGSAFAQELPYDSVDCDNAEGNPKLCTVEPDAPSAPTLPHQEKLGDSRPKLELEPQANFNGGGFNTFSGSMTGGFGMEDEHFSWHLSGTYDAAKKATYCIDEIAQCISNPHGNVRYITGSTFGRSGTWLYGTECEFVSLRTTNYNKTSWDCDVGGGHDWMHVTNRYSDKVASMRLIVTYILPIKGFRRIDFKDLRLLNKRDVENGFNFHFTLPSPIETGRHFFFDEHLFLGWICDPKCGHDARLSMGVLFRF